MYHTYDLVGRLETRFSLKEGTWCEAKWRYRTLRKPQKMFVVITLLCNYLYRHLMTTPEKSSCNSSRKNILEKRENETGMLGLCMERSQSIAGWATWPTIRAATSHTDPWYYLDIQRSLPIGYLNKQTNKVTLNNNYSPKWRWLVVAIYRTAKQWGKYPRLATNTEVNNCFSIY